MKVDPFIRLQKKYGGKWVATDKIGVKVYAVGKGVADLMKNVKKKKIPQSKIAIGYIEKYGRTYIYLSL